MTELPLRARISFGTGGGVYAVKEAAFTSFILIFYTQVLGLSGTVTGVVVALSLIWDGVSDPLVGSWSDRLRSRYGRRHPFMVYSTLPLAVGFIGLFSPPDWFTEHSPALAAWLLFWSLWVRTCTTLFSIPHLALSAELTTGYQERSHLMGLRLGFLFLFAVLLPAVGFAFLFETQDGVDGRFIPDNYPIYGLLSALTVIVLASIAIFGTRRYMSRPQSDDESFALPSFRTFISDFRSTFSNRTFRRIVFYDIAAAGSWGTVATLNMLVWTYFWEFDTMQVALLLAGPSLLAIPLVLLTLKPLGRRFQKPQMLRIALWGLIIDALWLYPLKMGGYLPEDIPALGFWLHMLMMLFWMYFFLLRVVSTMSIVADVTDEHELEAGSRSEGGFFSVVNFTTKAATVIGPLYGGIAVDVIGLDAKALPGTVPAPVLDQLIYALGLGAIPGLVIALYFASTITQTREHIAQVQATLQARSAAGE